MTDYSDYVTPLSCGFKRISLTAYYFKQKDISPKELAKEELRDLCNF